MDDVEQVSEGRGLPLQRVLTDTADRTGALIGAAVGLGLLVALVLVAVVVGDDAGTWVYAVLAISALAVLVLTYRRMRVWTGWGNPQLFLPSSNDLALGDSVVVRFRRVARRGSDPAGLTITCQLVAEEVTRRSDEAGRDTVEHIERVYEAPLEVVLVNVVGQTVEADLRLEVPVSEAPPTMNLPSNEVRWRLAVAMAAPGAPDDDSTFPLVVAPAVATRLQIGGGGR